MKSPVPPDGQNDGKRRTGGSGGTPHVRAEVE